MTDTSAVCCWQPPMMVVRFRAAVACRKRLGVSCASQGWAFLQLIALKFGSSSLGPSRKACKGNYLDASAPIQTPETPEEGRKEDLAGA